MRPNISKALPLSPRSSRVAGFFAAAPGPFIPPKWEDFRSGTDGFIKSGNEETKSAEAFFLDIEVKETLIRNIPARMYLPKGKNGLRPCILYFTGSAFLYPNLDWQKRNCFELARLTNSIVINIQEPCPPDHPFPAGINAAFSVLEEIFARSEYFGIDRNNISVCGFSSGACVATVTARRARDHKIPIKNQILLSGFLNLSLVDDPNSRLDGPGISHDLTTWAVREYAPNREARLHPEASPLLATDFSGLPPAIILVGERDPLCAQNEEYCKKLRDAGVKVQFYKLPGKIHEFFGPYGAYLWSGKNENPFQLIANSILEINFETDIKIYPLAQKLEALEEIIEWDAEEWGHTWSSIEEGKRLAHEQYQARLNEKAPPLAFVAYYEKNEKAFPIATFSLVGDIEHFLSDRVEDEMKNLFLSRVIVKKGFRNRGLGQWLINVATEKAQEYGFNELNLIRLSEREDLQHLYEKMGWKSAGDAKVWHWKMTLMWKSLAPSPSLQSK